MFFSGILIVGWIKSFFTRLWSLESSNVERVVAQNRLLESYIFWLLRQVLPRSMDNEGKGMIKRTISFGKTCLDMWEPDECNLTIWIHFWTIANLKVFKSSFLELKQGYTDATLLCDYQVQFCVLFILLFRALQKGSASNRWCLYVHCASIVHVTIQTLINTIQKTVGS